MNSINTVLYISMLILFHTTYESPQLNEISLGADTRTHQSELVRDISASSINNLNNKLLSTGNVATILCILYIMYII